MARTLRFKKQLEDFLRKYPENEPVHFDDAFRHDVKLICKELSLMEIAYSNFSPQSRMHVIIEYVTSVMMHFQKADILEPLNNTNFILYLKLSKLFSNFKRVIISEVMDDCSSIVETDCLFGYEKEQYICDTYKSKLDKLITSPNDTYNEEDVQTINENFTYFLLEYLRFLSKLKSKEELIEKNIKLSIEVADLRILVEYIHCISHFVSKSQKILICQKITNFCIEKNFNLKNCGFIKSNDRDYRFEICVISYYTLEYISNYLKLQKMYQTSQMLSSFTVEDSIEIIDIDTPDSVILKYSDELINHIIDFKTYKKIKSVPSPEIKKCLNILNLLLNSVSNNQVFNCKFGFVLLSILSMLYEFVMGTNLDKPTLTSLIDLVIGYLDMCQLPPNFKAVCYAFKIYQKLKSDDELEIKSIELCKSLSANLGKRKCNNLKFIKMDIEAVFCEDNWEDKSIVISYFLSDNSMVAVDCMKLSYYNLNENVLLSTQYSLTKNIRLIYPYSVSLNFSIINKDEDCLFNNLAVLDEYLTIHFNENQSIGFEDNKILLTTILRHYENISQSLPDDFLMKCWEYSLNPQSVDIGVSKALLQLCSSQDLSKFIDILKIKTMEIFEDTKQYENDDFYLYIHKLWHSLLNMNFINQKKKVRKDQVNHFCFILNRTFLFDKNKIKSEHSLILLLKLFCSLLKVPWLNKTPLMNCSLRIITFVEKSSNPNPVQSLTEAAELLIVLYKCPNNSIKPLLGLYTTSFANLLKKCWFFICSMRKMKDDKKNLFIPFHKLEKCSSLFKRNKADFEIICRYIIEDLIELVTLKTHLRDGFMRQFFNIIFNLMDVCSSEEMKQLMLNIQGPALLFLRSAYKEYRSNVRFTGRL